MGEEGKIVVVAGSMDQVKHWIRHNIIPVISKRDVELLRGCSAKEIHYEGTYYKWMDDRDHVIVQSRRVIK